MNELSTQYKTALELNQKIIIAAQMAQQNLYSMCVMLKEMRDGKLYKELGYQNFEDYCEQEVGMKRRNAYNYISIIEKTENVQSIAHFGMTKLSLLASLSEPEQKEIQDRVDLESTSVRKLKAEIEKLREDKADISGQVRSERQRAEKAEYDLTDAQRRIKELERRPITVVEDEQTKQENERLRSELEQAREAITELKGSETSDHELKNARATIRQLNKQLSNEAQDNANEQNRIRRQYQEEISRLTEQLQEQSKSIAAAEKTIEVPDAKGIFKAYYKNAIASFNAMLEFISSGLDAGSFSFCCDKTDNMLKALDTKLEELKKTEMYKRENSFT